MRRFFVAAALLLAGCDKTEPTHPPGKALVAAPIPYYPSYEVWCSRVKGVCKGDWEKHGPGTSALGRYRFVTVEVDHLRDGQGPARDVFLELATPQGTAYFGLGRTREGTVETSVIIEDIVDRPGALELRTVFRTSPHFTYSDYHGADFIIEGAHGLGVVEVPLGKIVGDDTGKSPQGTIGKAEWKSGKLRLQGATIADGEWAITLP